MDDNTGDSITINPVGQPVDHVRNMLTITTDNGFQNDGASTPRAITQPDMTQQVSTLIYFITSQAVRDAQSPTTTLKFARTPGIVNRKIIYYKTKSGKAL